MTDLRFGLIGSGFMGRCHAQAMMAAPVLFQLDIGVQRAMLADVDEASARQAANSLGFARSTGDWQTLVRDPEIDVVDITAPNALHKPMALAAIEAGKIVYCEKPLAPTAEEARLLMEAAEAAGTKTLVGYNYLRNPVVAMAKEIIVSGEIGDVVGYRGWHFEDYMTDPEAPFTWRHDPAGGDGVVGDLGSHAISMARYLVGDIEAVCGDRDTVTGSRPDPGTNKTMRPVSVADQMRALVRFGNGAKGVLEASWVATGRKMNLACEVTGSRGALTIDLERMNELRMYTTNQPTGREGFKTILAGPEHTDYGAFTPAPGHQLGFNDLKTIEIARLVKALATGEAPWPDFREAWEIQRVSDAITRSSETQSWVRIAKA
ncbi:MAG: Gfo/Idh/MocA family protein [Alphaproteobacteria bacterium]